MEGPRKRTPCSTLRRPTERNTVRADDFVAAVENLCIVRAGDHFHQSSNTETGGAFEALIFLR